MLERKIPQKTPEKDPVKLAQMAMDYVHHVLPRGSINKKSDEDKPDYQDIYNVLSQMRNRRKQIIQQVMLLDWNQKNDTPYHLKKMIFRDALYRKFKAGNCEEQATVAYVYLKKLGVEDVDYVCMQGGSHHFLLLNGNIICDPWANKIYHVKDFEKVRAAAATDIPYHDAVYEEFPTMRPYLFGLPHVKFRLDDKRPLSIVDGQFVRSGIENFNVDYSEYHQELEKAQSGSYRPAMK